MAAEAKGGVPTSLHASTTLDDAARSGCVVLKDWYVHAAVRVLVVFAWLVTLALEYCITVESMILVDGGGWLVIVCVAVLQNEVTVDTGSVSSRVSLTVDTTAASPGQRAG